MGEPRPDYVGLPSCIRAGEILGEKYRLERELGRGAMGTVWSAMHLSLGQRVAIKLISAEHAQSTEARARFSTEAKAAARLRSRHVVQVYDDGETPQGTPYIVMEYLEGESLEARLERETAVPLVDAVRITAQVARALARAHAHGVIHRDLKPGNIFLARNDEDDLGWTAKVLDFGIAKVEEQRGVSTTKTGTVLGTPLFMSPEQIRGASSVDFRADIYSLGMCFYNMVTGHLAYESESFGDILVSVCTAELPDIRGPAPWLSDGVAAWFRRCCARDPRDRFQRADELVEALEFAVGGGVLAAAGRSLPDGQLGPSGTIKGHCAPLVGRTAVLGADDSGTFTLRSTDALDATPRGEDARPSQPEASVIATYEEDQAETHRRRPLLVAGAIALGVAGLVAVGLARFGPNNAPANVPMAAAPTVHARTESRASTDGPRIAAATPAVEPVRAFRATAHSAAPTRSMAAPKDPKIGTRSSGSPAKPSDAPPRKPPLTLRGAKAAAVPDLGF